MIKDTINLLVIVIFFVGISYGQKNKVSYTKAPKWINKIEANYTAELKDSLSGSSKYYLLLDRQENVKLEHGFYHNAVMVLNNEGIQELADLSLHFDPSYQKLQIHKLNIIRGNEVIDKLANYKFDVVRREKNMERYIYDGALTAYMNIPDVRVGDVIEYSFSRIGYNLIYGGNYSDKLYMNYADTTERIYTRVIMPKEKKNIEKNNGGIAPAKTILNNTVEYLWDTSTTSPFLYDINTPSWYELNNSFEISEFTSWADVVNWGVNLYQTTPRERKQLKEASKEFIKSKDKDTIVVQAMRFVQDEIRYLGIEGGVNGMKPNRPLDVLKQRYGDCKAKSFLLSELLKLYEIESCPLLVHSSNGYNVDKVLPTPNAFNHCVVRIEKDGKPFYIDPTISNQGGDLERVFFPNYVCGLMLKNGVVSLDFFPTNKNSSTIISEEFVLSEIGGGATLNIETIYVGNAADRQRSYLASTSLNSVKNSCLSFYSRLYPSVKSAGNIEYTDNREVGNELIVREKYTIDSLWVKSKDNAKVISCEFSPIIMNDFLYPAKSPERTMPYYVNYPVNYEHKTIVKLPETWGGENELKEISSSAFDYKYVVAYDDNTVEITHKYKTLKNYIEPNEVFDFLEKHEEITNSLTYSLINDTSVVENTDSDWKNSFFLFGGVVLFIVIKKVYDKNYSV